eukprot:11172826-Lingulodinium_polyedra.AAC.1
MSTRQQGVSICCVGGAPVTCPRRVFKRSGHRSRPGQCRDGHLRQLRGRKAMLSCILLHTVLQYGLRRAVHC